MAKPTESINWATSANYPAGPEDEAGTPTKIVPSGHDATGWRPEEFPPAQYLNYWMNAIAKYIQWLTSLEDARWVNISIFDIPNLPAGLTPNGFTGEAQTNATSVTDQLVGIVTGIGQIPDGTRIDGLRFTIYGDGQGDISAAISIYNGVTRVMIGPDDGTSSIPPFMLNQQNAPAAWATYSTTFTPHVVDNSLGVYLLSVLASVYTTNFKILSFGYRLAAPA